MTSEDDRTDHASGANGARPSPREEIAPDHAASSSDDDTMTRFRALLESYRDTLNLVSPTHPTVIDDRIAEGRIYAGMIAERTSDDTAIADIGSGAGLPGIVLAHMLPRRTIFLIERRRRRIAFLTMAVSSLGLRNTEVVAGDARDVALPPCGVIVAQAVAQIDEIYCLSRHFHDTEILLASRKDAGGWRGEVDRLERRISRQITETIERGLDGHGSLIGLRLPGGLACRSSG